jgi:hypothetical protein
MCDIKVGDYVREIKSADSMNLFIVESINGDQAECVSFVNESKKATFLLANLIIVNPPDDRR